jgi:hypothetical protein
MSVTDCRKRGLTPSATTRNPWKSTVRDVPVPFFNTAKPRPLTPVLQLSPATALTKLTKHRKPAKNEPPRVSKYLQSDQITSNSPPSCRYLRPIVTVRTAKPRSDTPWSHCQPRSPSRSHQGLELPGSMIYLHVAKLTSTFLDLVTVHGVGRGRRRFSPIDFISEENVAPKTSSVPLCCQPVNACLDLRHDEAVPRSPLGIEPF